MPETINKRKRNPYGKLRTHNDPYATYIDPQFPGWEWRILKLNQSPDQAIGNPRAYAWCAVVSPETPAGDYDYLGDTYLDDIGRVLVSGTDILKECGR
jgi:hypothetical protein